MNEICVYRHRRLDTFEIFYVGIGSKKRSRSIQDRNDHWYNITNLTKFQVEILAENLDIETAKELEILLISQYGRRNKKSGTLCNMTDGGDGTFGYKHTNEAKEKMKIARKGQVFTKEHLEKLGKHNIGRIYSPEERLMFCKKVINTETGEIYDSPEILCNIINMNRNTLYAKLNGNRPNNTIYKYLKDD